MSDAHKPQGRVRWGYFNTARALSNKGKRVTEEEAKKREKEILSRKRVFRNTKNNSPHGHITIGEPDYGHEKPGDPKPKLRKPSDPRSHESSRCPEFFKFPGGIACGPKPVDANPLDDEGNPTPARKPDPEAKTPQQQQQQDHGDKREAERLLVKELLAAGTALADKIEASGFKSLDSEEKALYQKLKGKMYNSDAARINQAMGTFFVYQIKCPSGAFPPKCHRASVQIFDDDQLDKWQDKGGGWIIDTTHASVGDIPVDIQTYYKPTSKKVEGYIDWNRYGQPGEPKPGPDGKGYEGPYLSGGRLYKEGWPSAIEWEGSDFWLNYREMDIDVALASHGTSDVGAVMKAEGWFPEVPKVAALIELVEEDEKATHVATEATPEATPNDIPACTPGSDKICPPFVTTPAAALPETHDAGGRATLVYINSLKNACTMESGQYFVGNSCRLYEEALATREESPESPVDELRMLPPYADIAAPKGVALAPSIRVVRKGWQDSARCGGNNRHAYVVVGVDFMSWSRQVGAAEARKWVEEQTAICLDTLDFASVGVGNDFKPAKYIQAW
jgi:hypothetical protein